MSTFMTNSNTPEVKEELAALLLYEEGSEWAENTDRHYELAEAILSKFEVLSRAQEKASWAAYTAWVNGR